jgi:hypothetical protein
VREITQSCLQRKRKLDTIDDYFEPKNKNPKVIPKEATTHPLPQKIWVATCLEEEDDYKSRNGSSVEILGLFRLKADAKKAVLAAKREFIEDRIIVLDEEAVGSRLAAMLDKFEESFTGIKDEYLNDSQAIDELFGICNEGEYVSEKLSFSIKQHDLI